MSSAQLELRRVVNARLALAGGRMLRVFSVSVVVMLAGCGDAATDDSTSDRATESTSSRAVAASSNRAIDSINAATEPSAPRVSAAPPLPTANASTRDRCVVASVTDGDSMRCATQGRVRLLLLDAPEMSQTPFGARSRDALRNLVNRGDTVWLEYDVRREDQYGRTLAHVWTAPNGGTHVNLKQAADGWAVAVVFQPNVRYIEAIRRAVTTARQQKNGLWSDGQYSCEPVEHKRGNC